MTARGLVPIFWHHATSGEVDYLAVLEVLVAQYDQRLPRLGDEMTPREALAYLIETNRLAQSDLVECVGYR